MSAELAFNRSVDVDYGVAEEVAPQVRRYLHNEEDARPHELKAGMFTPWDDLPAGSDVLFYEGLHGAVKTAKVNIARHADLLIGIVPSINLEWLQKMHRDKSARGQTQEAIVETILRRMPDYKIGRAHV